MAFHPAFGAFHHPGGYVYPPPPVNMSAMMHSHPSMQLALIPPHPPLQTFTSTNHQPPTSKRQRRTRAKSGYCRFMSDPAVREEAKAGNPDASFGEMSKNMAAKWKSLDESQRQPYLENVPAASDDPVMVGGNPANAQGVPAVKDKKKRARSAYSFFMADADAREKASAGDSTNFGALSKLMGARWKALTPEERAPYIAQSETDKKQRKAERYAETCHGPLARQRAHTSHNCYIRDRDVRAAIQSRNPEWRMVDVTREMNTRWKTMSDDEKQPYRQEAAADRDKMTQAQHQGQFAPQHAAASAASAQPPQPLPWSASASHFPPRHPRCAAKTKPSNRDGANADKRKRWTEEEKQALEAGVRKYHLRDTCLWRTILEDDVFGPILANRTNIDLKDKWRNLGGHDAHAKTRVKKGDAKTAAPPPPVPAAQQARDEPPLAAAHASGKRKAAAVMWACSADCGFQDPSHAVVEAHEQSSCPAFAEICWRNEQAAHHANMVRAGMALHSSAV